MSAEKDERPGGQARDVPDNEQADCSTKCYKDARDTGWAVDLIADDDGDDDVRQRVWLFLLYPDSAPEDWPTIASELQLPIAVSPLHCLDRYPNGELKKPHWHGIAQYTGKKSRAQVAADLAPIGAVRIVRARDIAASTRYLCHLDIDPERVPGDRFKVRYPVQDIQTFGGFDADKYLTLRVSDKVVVQQEMREWVRSENVVDYDVFIDFVDEVRPDWAYMLDERGLAVGMRNYIDARWKRQQTEQRMIKGDRAEEMEQELREVRNALNRANSSLLDALADAGIEVRSSYEKRYDMKLAEESAGKEN